MEMKRNTKLIIVALIVTGVTNYIHYAKLFGNPNYPEPLQLIQWGFLWADGYMAFMALLGAIGLILRRNWGRVCGIVSGAALIHMAFADVAILSRLGTYASSPYGFWMVIVDAWSFIVSTLIIVGLWRMDPFPSRTN